MSCGNLWGDPYAPLFTWRSRRTRIGIAVMSLVLLVILIICLSVSGGNKGLPSLPQADDQRFDCTPDLYDNPSREECLSRGCIFDDSKRQSKSNLTIGFLPTPKCFYPEDWINYQIISVRQTPHEISVLLNKTEQKTGFDKDSSQNLKVVVKILDENRIRIRVTDPEVDRWEPPIPELNLPAVVNKVNFKSLKYNFSIEEGVIKVTRKSNHQLIFSTDIKKLIFSDQFLQMTTIVPSNELYGIGEIFDSHLRRVKPMKEQNNEGISEGIAERKRMMLHNFGDHPLPGRPVYGHHPFYLMYEGSSGDAHGVLLRNVNSMDIVFTSTPALTFRTTGGIFDFVIFMGPTPDEVMQQKTDLIGYSPLPPYWSLGFHLCRYGYRDENHLREAYERNTKAGLPLDVQWADIDYMNEYNMFTLDPNKFSKLPDIVKTVHNEGRFFIPILDPALDGTGNEMSAGYKAFLDGLEKDVFVKNTTGQLLKGRVWNTALSVFPDFTHPNCSSWWGKQMKEFHDILQYDGLWIDMNEPATFISGQDGGCINNTYDRPQFNPVHPMLLENLTICMSAQHYLSNHYNVHNMYSLFEAKMTYQSLIDIRQKRPFILSRATSTGQGSYTAHWTGDIDSSWDHLRISIPHVLDFGLFSIPFVGADICGFVHDTNQELCARWSAVGAFYTFARNHNDHFFIDQDPAAPEMGGTSGDVFKAAKSALEKRYTLLPYLYSLFFRNSLWGEPVLRSLRYNYPNETRLADIDDQFMWGRDVLINPILTEKTAERYAFFPPGKWYDWDNETVVSDHSFNVSMRSLWIPLTKINVAFRGGSIIPTHDPKNTTTEQRKDFFNLLVFLDHELNASGELYFDDGESLNTKEWEEYSHIKFGVNSGEFKSTVIKKNYNPKITIDSLLVEPMKVKQVTVYGVNKKPNNVRLETESNLDLKFDYNDSMQRLIILKNSDSDSIAHLLRDFKITWS